VRLPSYLELQPPRILPKSAMKSTAVAILCSAFVASEAARMKSSMNAAILQGCNAKMSQSECVGAIAHAIVAFSSKCFKEHQSDQMAYGSCTSGFCSKQCGTGKAMAQCQELCTSHAAPLFAKFVAAEEKKRDSEIAAGRAQLRAQAKKAAGEEAQALAELQEAQGRMLRLNRKIQARAEQEITGGNAAKGQAELAKVKQLAKIQALIQEHLSNVERFSDMGRKEEQKEQDTSEAPMNFLQTASTRTSRGPEDDLAREMTHDLEMNFNKIAPFGKEDTAKELQDHAAKTQDTLVDAVENAEVAEIKRAVFRALTRLRAATIKEFDTIARLETQAIDAYNDAHHYRAENPLAHLHEDEAPVETDKLKSFH